MNTATGLILYLMGAFALVAVCVVTPAIRYYLGAFVIFLFMGALFFAWANTIRQTNNMNKSASPPQRVQPKDKGTSQNKNEAGGSATPPLEPQQKQAAAQAP